MYAAEDFSRRDDVDEIDDLLVSEALDMLRDLLWADSVKSGQKHYQPEDSVYRLDGKLMGRKEQWE